MTSKTKSATATVIGMISVSLLWMLLLGVCNGLVCPNRLSLPTPLSAFASTSTSLALPSTSLSMASRTFGSESSGGGGIARSRQRDRAVKTLYDYLGASPRDTQEQLKIRYTTLVRTLHPDSKPDRETQNSYYELSDINAAWEVLKDPLERKKYDRSVQAKEIAEGIESLVNKGIQAFETTAIPWMKKTADTTVAAVDASTKKAQKVNEQARSAYGVFELEKESKAMDQKANADAARASKIQKELFSLSTKKIASLEKQQQQQQPLSSAEAQRILKSFAATTATAITKPPAGLSNDMKTFIDTEIKERDAFKTRLSTERSTQMAARKLEQAFKAEEIALKRLEDAQRAFEEARQHYAVAQEVDKEATVQERLAFQASTKIETTLERIRDKVRVGLLQQQDLFLDKKAKELKKEIDEWERSSRNYQQEAETLRMQAKEKAREE